MPVRKAGVGRPVWVRALGFAACLWATATATVMAAEVRPPVAAGSFYPRDAETLRATVVRLLSDAEVRVPEDLRAGPPFALVVPHAGYAYSGAVAAASYKLLEGKEPPSRVVLLGPPHRAHLVGACSVPDYAFYETPLGRVGVDSEVREQLCSSPLFRRTTSAHVEEHCVEVQLPFLQVLWSDPPPVLPVLVGMLDPARSAQVAAAIAEAIDDRSLLVVSTDFTHYGRRFGFTPFADAEGEDLRDRIRDLDMEVVSHLTRIDPGGFRDCMEATQATVCGRSSLGVVLDMFCGSELLRPVFLRWANSGAVTGRYSDCVSYVAMAFYAEEGALTDMRGRLRAGIPPAPGPLPVSLTDDEERSLLAFARDTVSAAVRADMEGPAPPERTEALRSFCGAFVTLRIDGRLRGCIGSTASTTPLWQAVGTAARTAAVGDPRFAPVEPGEVSQIKIEISVLGPIVPLSDVEELVIGRDGLVVVLGQASGLLLPQVAVENGWDTREFLAQTCAKARLPADAWQDPQARVYRFAARAFSE
jgi:AmmeMemoRadiSam system protein B/AmmeMemoRadiSam system protein A